MQQKDSFREDLIAHMRNVGVHCECDIDLSSFSYFKTGGVAKLIAYPADHNQLAECIKLLNEHDTAYKIIGETSNLIFLDDVEYSCLLCTSHMKALFYDPDNSQLVSDCGAMLPDLSRKALYESLTGLEGLEGIPGTVGGAVFMNAGAYGYDIKGVLDIVDVVLPDGSSKRYTVDELDLNYRHSVFRSKKSDEVISRCYFKAAKGNQEEIYSKMELFHAKRHRYQEFIYPNLGSLFSGSVYRALGERDIVYKLIASAYYLFCYKLKLFRRESPINRKWLNDITVKRFGISFEKQPFSDKTMNTLVNNGHHTDEILDYISQLKEKTGGKIPVENEVVEGF